MKKFALLTLLTIAAAVAFAALEFGSARTIPVLAPVSISAGSTNSTAVAVDSLKGTSELIVYANAQANRTALNVSLYTTNLVESGWSLISTATSTDTTFTPESAEPQTTRSAIVA